MKGRFSGISAPGAPRAARALRARVLQLLTFRCLLVSFPQGATSGPPVAFPQVFAICRGLACRRDCWMVDVIQSHSGVVVCQRQVWDLSTPCLLYTSPSPRDGLLSRMPS